MKTQKITLLITIIFLLTSTILFGNINNWLNTNYEGTADWGQTTIRSGAIKHTNEAKFSLKIRPTNRRYNHLKVQFGYSNYGKYVSVILIIPGNNNISGLSITNDKIYFSPTASYPYKINITKRGNMLSGQIIEYRMTSTGKLEPLNEIYRFSAVQK